MSERKTEGGSPESIRINKYLSDAGVCSRREADRLIGEGRVRIDGRIAEMGDRISDGSLVLVDGKPVQKEEKKVLLLFHKPRGIVCSTKQQRNETTVTDYLNYPIRIYPIGRLDKESEGLLLLTNQGDLLNKIMRAGNYHEKEYLVKVDRLVTDAFIKKMSSGVPVLDTVTRPCTVEKTGDHSFRIILTQGLNRQIRRMCEYLGYKVTELKRVRIMHLTLDGIRPGAYREITEDEWNELMKGIAGSSSETVLPAGGKHGEYKQEHHRRNERIVSEASGSVKGVLPGGPGDYEQLRVRRSVRPSGSAGDRERNRAGRISNGKRRV
ncbi:MAG: pseudouridine synthase [Clostridiales bacterium]|nr:pseudouridine synthase [Candidatus Blautia equi]